MLAAARAAVAIAVIVVLVAAADVAAQTGPARTTTNAVNRLLNDTRGLSARDAPAARRRVLLRIAVQLSTEALRRPCRALRLARRYRAALGPVSIRGRAAPGRRPGDASVRGTLARDVLAVDAGLRQLPGTRRCGGGASTAAAALESRPARSTTRTLRLRVRLPVARWEARSGGGRDFIGLNMDGADALGDVGEPGVPAFARLFAVPRGARVSVRVSDVRGYTLSGIDVFPKQEQAVDQDPAAGPPPASLFADQPFAIDRGAYRSRAAVPRRLAHVETLGRLRDLNIAAVQVPGAQYDPRRRRARIFTSMTLTVTFRGGDGTWRSRQARTALESPFERIYASALDNFRTVARAGRAGRAGAAQAVPPCGEEYLIVTSPALRPAADRLADAKRAAGMVVTVTEFAAGTPSADIRTFIRARLNDTACVRPTYVLLLGDTSHVGSFVEPWCTEPTGCQVTSDLSYSLDGVGTDLFADVLLGRIPANTLDVADRTVQKIVRYQTEPPAPPGDDFYNHATVTSAFEGLGPRDTRGFTMSSERFRAGLRSRGHVVHRLYHAQPAADVQLFKDNTALPPELRRPALAWDANRDQLVSELNAGRFLLLHRDHGSRVSWANPPISVNDMGLLNTTSTELPVVFAMNCSSGSFQFPGSPSISERLLQHEGGGAVAVIGDTDVSPTVQNDQLTVGFGDAMFPATVPAFGSEVPLRRMGEILNAGKAYMAAQAGASQQLTGNVLREHLLWHLLGDPSMEVRAAEPSRFDPAQVAARFEHRRDAYPVGDPSFRVRVGITQPGTEGPLVTLTHGTDVIGRGEVSGGVALITPTVRTDSANLAVSLERDGFIPERIPVRAPVPSVVVRCPQPVVVPAEDSAQITGSLAPAVSGATIKLKVTRPSGKATTHTTTTTASSTWAIQVPMTTADRGVVGVQVFFDGELKYGADHAACLFLVE